MCRYAETVIYRIFHSNAANGERTISRRVFHRQVGLSSVDDIVMAIYKVLQYAEATFWLYLKM